MGSLVTILNVSRRKDNPDIDGFTPRKECYLTISDRMWEASRRFQRFVLSKPEREQTVRLLESCPAR